jgi:hypothetical protein
MIPGGLFFMMKFKAMPTTTISDREIFAVGTWTDSDGASRQWTSEELDTMIQRFGAEPETIPLKAGHSTDAYNAQLAEAMSLPVSLLTGEDGNGAVRFGAITNLHRNGDTLLADFTNVPQSIADLIETQMYAQVSCEIELDDDGPRLSAVALLGAEQPAVKGLASISFARFSSNGGPWVDIRRDTDWSELEQRLSEALTENKIGRFAELLRFIGAQQGDDNSDGRPNKGWWDRCMAALQLFPAISDPVQFAGRIWFNGDPFAQATFETPESSIRAVRDIGEWLKLQGDDAMVTPNPGQVAEHMLMPEDLPAVYEALGLPDTATLDDVLAAIAAMKGGGEDEMPPMEGMMSEEQVAQFAQHPVVVKLREQVDLLAQENATMKREQTKVSFKAMAERWTAIPGTPDELAEQLVELHYTAGEKAAQLVIDGYNKMHDTAVANHLLEPIGTARGGTPDLGEDEFAVKVQEYAEKHEISPDKALAYFAVSDPQGYAQHMRRVRYQMAS